MVTGCTRSNDGLDPKSRSQLCTESLMTNTCKNPSNPSTRHRPPERYLPALRRRGLTAALTYGRLRVTPPEKLTADVAAVLAEHAAEIKAELMAEASATATAPQAPAPVTPPIGADVPEHPRRWRAGTRRAERWTDETHELIAWFRTTLPPDEPFDTPGGLTVSTPRRYWALLADWIADGTDSPHPGLTANLRQLRTISEERHG